MHSLVDLHGYVNIPKGTLLYRGHKDSSYNDCMFFASNAFVAGVFDDNIQIWETTKNIQVLFLKLKRMNESTTIKLTKSIIDSFKNFTHA